MPPLTEVWLTGQMQLEVTDGWYGARASLDDLLAARVQASHLSIGAHTGAPYLSMPS